MRPRLLLPQLPSEILESEVLPRLPAKSVGRLRCVCKAWNTFLSTPTFARMHLPYQTTNKLLLLNHDLPSRTTKSFRTLDCQPLNHDSIATTHAIPFEQGEVLILASLDGLLCVALTKTRELAFWNPLTGAYKKLCTSNYFDEICKSTAFAFYIDSSNDYKLLHIVSSECVFIYSRRLDSWRKINVSFEVRFSWYLATFSGDKVYFRLENWSVIGEKRMMSFDVDSEEFKDIQLPPIPCLPGAVTLVALNGCNHFCVTYRGPDLDSNQMTCDVWRMDGDGWIKVAEFIRRVDNSMLRYMHTKRNGNWLAIGNDDDNDKSFKNIDMAHFFTEFLCFLPFRWTSESNGAIYTETLLSPDH